MAGGEKGPTKSNLELLLVALSGATGAAKLRVRTFRGRPRAWLVKGLGNLGIEINLITSNDFMSNHKLFIFKYICK